MYNDKRRTYQYLRRWSNFKTTLGRRLVLAGYTGSHICLLLFNPFTADHDYSRLTLSLLIMTTVV